MNFVSFRFTPNHYGYRVRVFDIDGVTPLANVKISGVTSISREIRTNPKGYATFITANPTETVTFSEFPTGFANASQYGSTKLQGYINQLTDFVVAGNTSSMAGYKVTLLDDTGAAVANKSVNCTTNKKSYNTDASGTISDIIYSESTSLVFSWTNSTSATKKEGSMNYTESTEVKYTCTFSGTVGKVTTASNKATKGAATTNIKNCYIDSSTDPIATGAILTIGENDWIIVHIDNDNFVALIMPEKCYWEDLVTPWSANDQSGTYENSDVDSFCVAIADGADEAVGRWLHSSLLAPYTLNLTDGSSVVRYSFAPLKEMLDPSSGFDYFVGAASNINAVRVYQTTSGEAVPYWCSNGTPDFSYISDTGEIETCSTPYEVGYPIRPVLAVNLAAVV